MVQNQAQKAVQAKDKGNAALESNTMPQFMSKSPNGTGYLFRRGVPEDVRTIIGKREFKTALGGDYRNASQRCRELAVNTDQQIAAARAQKSGSLLASTKPHEPCKAQAPNAPTLTTIHAVTNELKASLWPTVLDQVLNGDRNERLYTKVAIDARAKLQQIARVKNWAELAYQGDDTAINGWSDMLEGTLKRSGHCLANEIKGTLQERDLLIEYAAAYRHALDTLEAQYTGKPTPPLAGHLATALAAATSQQAPQSPNTKLLSEVIQDFLDNYPPTKPAMSKKHGFILPAFVEVVGDMPITELRQSHVKDFLLTVQKLPPRWQDLHHKKNKTIRELANQSWDTTIALATYDGTYRASLSAFIDSAVGDWQDIGFPTTLTTNISYTGSRTKSENKQRAVRTNELKKIFFNEEMEKIIKTPSLVYRFWLLAIELYTGARVREICQINPQYDWGEKDGIWWLKLTNEPGPNPDPEVTKSVKTIPRTIPMHPELVRVGLPKYLQSLKDSKARRLFPKWSANEGNAGAASGKWVVNYLHKIGLHGAANENGNAIRGSHSFRHTLLTHGRLHGVNLRCISGHKESSDNAVADGYEDDTLLRPLQEMARLLAKLDYGIKLPTPVGHT